jgi:hypothetical protein
VDDGSGARNPAEQLRSDWVTVRRVVRSAVGPNDDEDATQNVFIRMFESGGYDRFDPAKGSRVAYLASFASLSSRNERDKVLRARRALADQPIEGIAEHQHPTVEVYEVVETRVDLERMIEHVKVRTRTVQLADDVTLADVIDGLAELTRTHGEATTVLVAKMFGVSRSTARRWMRKAYAEIAA